MRHKSVQEFSRPSSATLARLLRRRFERGANATFNNLEANFKYQLTPALLAGLAFDYTDGNSVTRANGTSQSGAKYFQYALGTDYFLSKRMDVYLMGVYQHASGMDSTGNSAVASIAGLTSSSTNNVFMAPRWYPPQVLIRPVTVVPEAPPGAFFIVQWQSASDNDPDITSAQATGFFENLFAGNMHRHCSERESPG